MSGQKGKNFEAGAGAGAVKMGAVSGSVKQPWQTREGGAGRQQPAGLMRDCLAGGLMRKPGAADKRQWHQSWEGVKRQEDTVEEASVGERWR
jgi:hypothetical protein